jgi:hypothetical protein
VSEGTMNNFTNDLCANLLKAIPHANSPSPEFALEIAPLIHSVGLVWWRPMWLIFGGVKISPLSEYALAG